MGGQFAPKSVVNLDWKVVVNLTVFSNGLEFNYGFLPHFNLEILGEFKSQNCFQIIDLQKDYFGIDKRRWIIANNSTVPVQRSKQCSLGLSFAKHNWLLSLENFYKKVIGINSLGQEFQNQLEFVKINGEYEVLGSEMLVQKKINHFITWMSYSFNTNNYYFQENTPTVFPNNFELEHIVSWAGIYEKNNFKIALGSKWHSGKPITTPLTTETSNGTTLSPSIKYNSPNNSNLDSFFQANFSTTYKWKSSTGVNYKIGFSVVNVLNKSNIVNRYYTVDAITKNIDDVNSFALGRTPNLSFRVEF
ncbi:MAG: TonB-dependent receptor [Flavobacterium sp.]|nr:TonB-dependent receptor [Flavobacterium sp.]